MNENFTKADLKVGYVVRMRDGYVCVVSATEDGRLIFKTKTGWLCITGVNTFYKSSYTDDLRYALATDTDNHRFDVVEVYGYAKHAQNAVDVSTYDRTLLWKREEAKKMTVSEIEKALGYKVEVVAEEK